MTRGRAAALGAGLLLVLVAAGVTSEGSPSRSERPGASARDAGPGGLQAYRRLLEATDHDVRLLDETPSRADPAKDETLILLDPGELDEADVAALGEYVEKGGRLVFGGDADDSGFSGVADTEVARSQDPAGFAAPLAPVPEAFGVDRARFDRGEVFRGAGRALPVLGARGSPIVLVRSRGEGTSILVSDASALTNGLLGEADNRQLAVNLAGAAGRPVAFVDRVQVAQQSGWTAIPQRWRFAFAGLFMAGLIFIWSRIRRLAPMTESAKRPAPPRRRYVAALGEALGAAGAGPAGERLRRRARTQLTRRAGLPPDAPEEEVAAAARRFGLSDEQVEALGTPVREEGGLMRNAESLAFLGDFRR